MDWVIDTDVLVGVDSGNEDHGHCLNVIHLLGIIRQSDHFIVIDHEGTIQRQYQKNLKRQGWVHRFLKDFVNQSKIRYESGKLNNRLTSKLNSLHFDPDDHVFVAVAYATRGDSVGRLVAEESDYTDSVIEYLLEQNVRVMDCSAALAEAGPEQEV